MNRFTRDVLVERARLALTDPAGEADALFPLTEAKVLDIIMWRPEKPVATRRTSGHAAAVDRDLDIADRLGIPMAGSGMIHCPAHEDRSKSLSYRWADGDRLLLHCFAGCPWEAIVRVP